MSNTALLSGIQKINRFLTEQTLVITKKHPIYSFFLI
jgi:hypothetical protein